ncbi:MAG: hypothetical protein IJW64_02120, partial [Clostridia bacterium]|nr:hypothetical protein [Clostridia bacterium]
MKTNLNFIKTQMQYYSEDLGIVGSDGTTNYWSTVSNPTYYYVGKTDYKTSIIIDPNKFKSVNQYSSIKYVLTATSDTNLAGLVSQIPCEKVGNKVIFDIKNVCQTITQETEYELINLKSVSFYAKGENAPYLELVPKHVINEPIKEFSTCPKSKVVVDLKNGKTQNQITLIEKENAFGKTDVNLAIIDGETKLAFDEKFVDGVYTDALGNQRQALEWFYYVDDLGEGIIIDNSYVTAHLDGSFSCYMDGATRQVKRLQILDDKTTAQTELKGVKDASVLNARSEEMQKAKEQYENSKRFIEDVVYGTCSLDSSGKVQIHTCTAFANQANLGASIENVTLNSSVSGREVFLLSTSNFISLKNSVGKNSGGSYIFDEVQEYLFSLAPNVYEDLKTAYNQLVVAEENLNYLKRNTPVNFLSENDLHKGFNEYGELTILFTSQNDYVTINRDRNGKIVALSDEKENVLDFKYAKGGDLEYVYDSRGRITEISKTADGDLQIKYPDGKILTATQGDITVNEQTQKQLTQITYDGILVELSYSTDGSLSAITRKNGQNLIDNMQVSIADNLVTLTHTDNSIEKLQLQDGIVSQRVYIKGGVVIDGEKREVLSDGFKFFPNKLVHYAKKDNLYKDESQLTFADGTEENPYEKYALTNFNDDENPVYTEELSENVLTKT